MIFARTMLELVSGSDRMIFRSPFEAMLCRSCVIPKLLASLAARCEEVDVDFPTQHGLGYGLVHWKLLRGIIDVLELRVCQSLGGGFKHVC